MNFFAFDEKKHANSNGEILNEWEPYAFEVQLKPSTKNVISLSVLSEGISVLTLDYLQLFDGE